MGVIETGPVKQIILEKSIEKKKGRKREKMNKERKKERKEKEKIYFGDCMLWMDGWEQKLV